MQLPEALVASEPILRFKREKLSMFNGNRPVTVLGQLEVSRLVKALGELDPMKSGAPPTSGFIDMSEMWFGRSPVDAYLLPLLAQIRVAASVRLKHELRVLKAVIDTVDEGSCLMPHSDDYAHHGLALRTHVPLIISPGSIGTSYHPFTLEPTFWRMQKVGRLYAFNNFEPHTVTKLDAGIRAHLVVDLVVKELQPAGKVSMLSEPWMLIGRGDSTKYTCPNLITHTMGNFVLRNRLAELHGAPVRETQPEQNTPENARLTREWIQRSAREALEAGQLLDV